MIQGIGTIAALWRYPVKSMQGEQLTQAPLGARGLLGDRAYAIQDRASGYIASAKHPRKWAALLACQARFATPPADPAELPPVLIRLPDGTIVSSAQPDIDAQLSRALGREVRLIARAPALAQREANRAPADAPAGAEQITQEPLGVAAPAGTFFDYAALHLISEATLRRLLELHPLGQFAVQRFRPNILVAPDDPAPQFIENGWLGQTIRLGAEATIAAIDPSPRCVMTTLAQAGLPHDPHILRTIAQHSAAASVTAAPGAIFSGVAGIYASVLQGGPLRIGDRLALQPAAQTLDECQ